MTDNLTNKFGGIEQQLATQHAELMQALNNIAFALGAPPTTPTVSIADLVNVLTELNTTLTAFHNEYTNNQLYLASWLEVAGINIETMLTNNSYNTQQLIIAIAANDPCKPCDTPIFTLPPSDTTITPADIEHCKRMQALIYALSRFTVKLDALSSFGVGFSPTVLRDAFNEVIVELGVTGDLLLPSVLEVAQIVSASLGYVASNLFSNTNLFMLFQELKGQLLTALYDTDSANAGMSAYRAVINGSSLPSAIKTLFTAMGYTSLFNLYYDRTKTLQLSGYDGTICAPAEIDDCVTIHAPADEFTRMNGAYVEVLIDQMTALKERFNADTTVEVDVLAEMAINRFNYDLIQPNTPTLLSSLRFRTYITSDAPASAMTVTFCHLSPAGAS